MSKASSTSDHEQPRARSSARPGVRLRVRAPPLQHRGHDRARRAVCRVLSHRAAAAAELNKAQRTCRTKLDVQDPFGATSGRAVPPRSLAWPELSCTAGAITTFWAITALGRSKCSRTSLQHRTELQPLRAPRHPLRAAALSRQRCAAAFRTDKASPRVRCLHPAAATHVCASYRSGAPRKASPRTARRRHTLPNASPLRAAATLSRAAATSPCSGFPPLAFHTPYSNAVREQGDPCHEHGPYL